VITRKDLSCSSAAVQAGHALAEFCLNSSKSREWNNHVLIYLGVDNKKELEKICYKLERKNIEYFKFREPDHNNEITSISVLLDNSLFFSKLSLLD
jgi:peptidyl-tRNA hydrolase